MKLKGSPGLGQPILAESLNSSTEGLAGLPRRPPSMDALHKHPQEARLLHRGVTVERARCGVGGFAMVWYAQWTNLSSD